MSDYDMLLKPDKNTDPVIVCGHACEDTLNVLSCDCTCQVASLEVDLKRFKKPVVKLDFSSIVKFRDLDLGLLGGISAANARFTLKLYRVTECCKKVCLGTFTYGRYYNDIALLEVGLFLAATSDSFSFTTCDHPICDDCITYFIEVHENTFDESLATKLLLTQINFNAIVVDQE